MMDRGESMSDTHDIGDVIPADMVVDLRATDNAEPGIFVTDGGTFIGQRLEDGSVQLLDRRTTLLAHPDYLEAYHELTSNALAEIALMQGRGAHDDAATAVGNLRLMQDALWDQRRATAERDVAP